VNTREEKTKNAIELWKKLNISECVMNFSCGGDSMNDYNFIFTNKENEIVESLELDYFFQDEVFENVEFYVNSDGHYIGEEGEVLISLDNEDETLFIYEKSSQSEWNENFSGQGVFPLTIEEINFLQDKVHSIIGGTDGKDFNYKRDCILRDEEEVLAKNLLDRISEFAEDFEDFESEGEPSDWFNFTTNLGEDELVIDANNNLEIAIERSFYVMKDE
jgi:hypothetical protein